MTVVIATAYPYSTLCLYPLLINMATQAPKILNP